jgi:hypothetical protein
VNEQELVHRAEQALLGGLLAGGDAGSVSHVRAGDLRDPRHRAILAAFTGVKATASGRGGWLRSRLDRGARQRVREALAYLDVLAGMCPEPDHLASYAAMLTGARSGPAVPGQAGAGEQLASAGSWLAENGTRARRGARTASASADGQGAVSGDVLQDREIASLARVLRPAVESRVEAARKARASRQSPVSGPVAAHASTSVGGRGRGTQPGVNRESLQRLVLADLMRRPADGRSAVARIPAEMLTAGPLRELYEMISARIVAGEPVDPVIIAWEVRQRDGAVEPASEAAARWSLSAIALKIGSTPTARGTARVFGRALLADHVLTERFGIGWTQDPELGGWLGASGPNAPGQPASGALSLARGHAPGHRAAPVLGSVDPDDVVVVEVWSRVRCHGLPCSR